MLATHGSRLRGGIRTGSGPVETRFGGPQPPMWAAHVPLSGSRTISPTTRPALSGSGTPGRKLGKGIPGTGDTGDRTRWVHTENRELRNPGGWDPSDRQPVRRGSELGAREIGESQLRLQGRDPRPLSVEDSQDAWSPGGSDQKLGDGSIHPRHAPVLSRTCLDSPLPLRQPEVIRMVLAESCLVGGQSIGVA